MFCFVVVLPFSDEVPLMESHYKERSGVFGCDGHLVFSNVSSKTLFGEDFPTVYVAQIPGKLKVPRGSEDGALNSDIFVTVWGQIFADGRFQGYDWTIKMEVDTLLVPPVLESILARYPGAESKPMYFQTAAATLPGPLEILSQAAMKYFAGTGEHCASVIENRGKSEAQYLSACLDSLRIPKQVEPSLLKGLTSAEPACDGTHAAFYPVRTWPMALRCWEQAGHHVLQSDPKVADPMEAVSLFCFTVVMPASYEAILVAAQYLEGAGVFSCDSYLLVSNVSSKDLFGPGIHPARWPSHGPEVKIIAGPLHVRQTKTSATPSNAGLFIKVWTEIFRDSRYLKYDWTIKLDPDTVLMPNRVRELLWNHCPVRGACDAMYLDNSGREMHGSIEAISQRAVIKFIEGFHRCSSEVSPDGKGEDEYLSKCFQLMNVRGVQEPELLGEHLVGHNRTSPCHGRRAAFHAFKSWSEYFVCLKQAGYYTGKKANRRDEWHLSDAAEKPSLFCFTVASNPGFEIELLVHQQKAGLGIFSCDDRAIVSNSSAGGPADRGQLKIDIVLRDVSILPSHPHDRGGRSLAELSSQVFVEAWRAVFADGRFHQHDWTVKLDSDAVFVPPRARRLLLQHCQNSMCGPRYLANFGKDLHWPVEAINRLGMEQYAAGLDRCLAQPGLRGMQEDRFLGACWDLLGVESVEEPRLLSDEHGYQNRCDTMHSVFHPFRDWHQYYGCLCESGFGAQACRGVLASTTTATTTTETATTTSTVRNSTVGDDGDGDLVIVTDGDGAATGEGLGSEGGGPRSRESADDAGGLSDHADVVAPGSIREPSLGGAHPGRPSRLANVSGAALRLYLAGAGGLAAGLSAVFAAAWCLRRARLRRLEAAWPTAVPTSPSAAELSETVKMLDPVPSAAETESETVLLTGRGRDAEEAPVSARTTDALLPRDAPAE